MFNKVLSKNVYVLVDANKKIYTSFEEVYTHWNKDKRQLISEVPDYLIIYNGKELFTGIPLNELDLNKIQEDLLVDKNDFEKASKLEVLTYIKMLTQVNKLQCFLCRFDSFRSKGIQQKPIQRKKNN